MRGQSIRPACRLFHRPETPAKFCIRGTQSRLRIDLEMTRKIDRRKKQIPQLLFDSGRSRTFSRPVQLSLEFTDLLLQLGEEFTGAPVGIGPVEADLRS